MKEQELAVKKLNTFLEINGIPYTVQWLVGFVRTPMVFYKDDNGDSLVSRKGTPFRQFMEIYNVTTTKKMLEAPVIIKELLVLANKCTK